MYLDVGDEKKVEVKLSNGKYLITNRELEENSSTRVKSALFNRGGKSQLPND